MKHFIFHNKHKYKICVVFVYSDKEPNGSNIIQNWAKENGIKFKWAAVYTKEQNGRAERTNNLLIIIAQYLRKAARLLKNI